MQCVTQLIRLFCPSIQNQDKQFAGKDLKERNSVSCDGLGQMFDK